MVFFPSGSSFLRAPLGRCLIWRPEKRTRSRFVTSRLIIPFLFFSEKKRDGWIILLPLDRARLRRRYERRIDRQQEKDEEDYERN